MSSRPARLATAAAIMIWSLIMTSFTACQVDTATSLSTEADLQTPQLTVARADSQEQAPTSRNQLPKLLPGLQEWHGQWQGQPVWLRLLPPDEGLNGQRLMKLLYSQPAPPDLGGVVLADHPWVLLNPSGFLVAWHERGSSGSQIQFDERTGYAVTAEYEQQIGDQLFAQVEHYHLMHGPAWMHHCWPLMLSLCWQEGTTASVPVSQFFRLSPDQVMTTRLRWESHQLWMDDQLFRIRPDEHGRLAEIIDQHGQSLLSVSEWLMPHGSKDW